MFDIFKFTDASFSPYNGHKEGVGLFLLAGGSVSMIPTIAGVGTIITAFFMGPLIEFFNVKIARPVLKGKK